jgi:hypothetical protein
MFFQKKPKWQNTRVFCGFGLFCGICFLKKTVVAVVAVLQAVSMVDTVCVSIVVSVVSVERVKQCQYKLGCISCHVASGLLVVTPLNWVMDITVSTQPVWQRCPHWKIGWKKLVSCFSGFSGKG